MWWRFRQGRVGEELSGQMKASLIGQYLLDPQVVDKLRFSDKRGRYCGRPVRFIRIFDPALVQGDKPAGPSYEALAQAPGRRRALLFEGHVEKTDAQIYFTDRRSPVALFPME